MERERESVRQRESQRESTWPERGGETPRHDVSLRLSQERRKNVNLNPFGPDLPFSILTLSLGCQGFKQFLALFQASRGLGDTRCKGLFEPRPGPSGTERFGETRSALLFALNEVKDLSEAPTRPLFPSGPQIRGCQTMGSRPWPHSTSTQEFDDASATSIARYCDKSRCLTS